MVNRLVAIAMCGAVAAAGCGASRSQTVTTAEARSAVVRAKVPADQATSAATTLNRFGFGLLRPELGTQKGNVAISAWSIATALMMVRAGAVGRTASEMDGVLGIADVNARHREMNALDAELASRAGTFPSGDKKLGVELAAANRVFAQKDLPFAQAFLDTLAASYGAGVGIVDYNTATEKARVGINAWVADRTRDRIRELLVPGVLDDSTRLVLVNAVYLHADWAVPFEADATTDGAFHAPTGDVTGRFMHKVVGGIASGDGWKAVDLSYAGGQLSMTILVPDAGRFDQVVAGLDPSLLTAATSTRKAQVALSLPRFDIAKSLDLKDQLGRLGMPTAFTGAADFSGMTTASPLELSDVVHQANVTVDEKGTTAAAATAAVMREVSAPLIDETLQVDRPFLFLLRDRPTGAVVFAGQVTNPIVKT
jgi:serpin B